ncbi:hypothetical protein FHS83_002821 [Rhizomicrobium palustre]|uniref:EF-hand domain-containing protein n=1 Tax=Rhizomicrobium palustre TaxID=189966 RepID=A0A846N1M3_9PROT|nr:hypothetical protein [Rhizomicrobium palustre]NIK89503.1 hypothetical protein [Rhizomicrobium palustre]
MRTKLLGAAALSVLALVLSACGGGGERMPVHVGEEWHGPILILRRYAGPDGYLTRKQLEEGLRKDFDAADLNHDGVLQPDEARVVNQARWKEDQSAISPLQDWNGDGVIDFNEFAATARALFNQVDRDGNGVLTPQELRISGKDGTKTGPDDAPQDGKQGAPEREHRRGGHGTAG